MDRRNVWYSCGFCFLCLLFFWERLLKCGIVCCGVCGS